MWKFTILTVTTFINLVYSQQNSAIASIASILANVSVNPIKAAGGTGLNITTIETLPSANSPVMNMLIMSKTEGNKNKFVGIVGGEDYSINQVPWQVSIQQQGSHFCGGTLIDKKTVLTAAHCCIGHGASSLQIRAKSSKNNSGGVTSSVNEIRSHPSYNILSTNMDYCILKLVTPIITSYAKLPERANKKVADGTKCMVSGWGLRNQNANTAPNQQEVVIDFISKTKYNRLYGEKSPDFMMCASSPGKNSCQSLGKSSGKGERLVEIFKFLLTIR